jgi:TetR/AcrR family transcriptional regulator, transcriptional repressor for nem operon
MKVSREQVAANRERILDEAARLFRERGFNGIGVADLMKSAGLTHGGFYGHFSSKKDLIAQVCQRAARTMIETWKRAADSNAADPLAAVVVPYLSREHRDRSGTGCLIAALGPEVSRQAAPVRHAVTEGVRSTLDTLARLTPGRSAAAKRQKAIATLASMVGAVVIARAVNDRKLSDEILKASSGTITARDKACPRAGPARP